MNKQMESQFTTLRSLPPLVEGKIHGYLKCTIDEVVWTKRNPGNVNILTSWWGELDNAVFRPASSKTDTIKSDKDVVKTYAIKTNLELFKEYLKNSETVELTVVTEKSHQVIGKAYITNLLAIFANKFYAQYFSICNDHGCKIGEVHVTLKLITQRNSERPSESDIIGKKQIDPTRLLTELPSTHPSVLFSNTRVNSKGPPIYESLLIGNKHGEPYERSCFNNNTHEMNSCVTDKLVAQVVARAQKLRGEMFSDTNDDDLSMFDDNSTSNSIDSRRSVENETALHKYFMGRQMSRRNEKKALETLRSYSPTPSLIEFAAATIRTCSKNTSLSPDECTNPEDNPIEDLSNDTPISSNQMSIQHKQACPIDYVDSLRILVDSLTLNSAGYRRVQSSCLSRGDGIPLSVTYFVQYDAIFGNIKKFNKKISNGSKPVKMISKKQTGQVIYFNHDAVHDLPQSYLHMDMPLKFKIYNRHLNQRTPSELGAASIYVSDIARTPYLCSTQRLAIIKKDIKIGELKVTVELGCDRIHFGKQFVEAVTSAKENIPVLELSANSNRTSNRYYNSTSGDEAKTDRKTTAPERREAARNTKHSKVTDTKISAEKQRDDGRVIGKGMSNCFQEKSLLHALIYISEGKNLPVSNSYLICRAFWREDRALSRICATTNNPFYHFHQLIPLIHDQELLNRTKDNCIITEVYSKNPTGNDNLVGIAKLSVHQLYVAYRDPLVVPHLLKSKYPVTSVDGWVPITDPVTGALRGELLALVALGTADQIALLEMTRGLRDSLSTSEASNNVTRDSSDIHRISSADRINTVNTENIITNVRTEQMRNVPDSYNTGLPNMRTQECQTEISTVADFKTHQTDEVYFQREDNTVLHAIVDRLAHALTVPKAITNQGAQTDLEFPTRDVTHGKIDHACDIEPVCLNASNSNSFCGDSYDESPRGNYNISREIFRSVGVGAEFNDPINQASSTDYGVQKSDSDGAGRFFNTQFGEPTKDIDKKVRRDRSGSDRNTQSISDDQHDIESNTKIAEEAAFRAIVEIECALHLPKIETADEVIEPSTYVTFQKVRNNGTDRIGAYMITNICPYSCNPKYDWRADTTLSMDLLTKGEKRLIMKVWRIIEPDVKMEINLEKDVVIGFSAIDLSVLTAGFPIVSGWFHIIDFSGKCNGQMKISVTPLDNISTCGTFNSVPSPSSIPSVNQLDHFLPYLKNIQDAVEEVDINTVEDNPHAMTINRGEIDNGPIIDIGLNLGDASMSFLSSSLKQKLSELDEIKKRLQSRLQDVTDTAFDDEFENDFDLVEHENIQVSNDKNGNDRGGESSETVSWFVQQPNDRHVNTTDNNFLDKRQRHSLYCDIDDQTAVETIATDTGYSTSSNARSELENGIHLQNNRTSVSQSLKDNSNSGNVDTTFNLSRDLNGHTHAHDSQNRRTNECDYYLDASKIEHCKNMDVNDRIINEQNSDSSVTMSHNHHVNRNVPIQGTRVHINHLLDKLSTQLTTAPPPIANLPMKRNIMDLITSLRRNNNNFSNDIKCNREANVRTVPTQTDINYINDSFSRSNSVERVNDTPSNNEDSLKDDGEIPAKSQRRGKISTVIRDELIADDHTDPIDYDYLSTCLMTSNIRHMASDTAFNPLLYPHILPEIYVSGNESRNHNQQDLTSPSGSPEGDAIEQLDSRYVETFNATINKGLSRLRDTSDMESTSSRIPQRFPSPLDNTAIFRVTPTGVSENIDGNIDVTVMHKPCNDDLMASNSIESSTTISIGNDMQTVTEIDDNSSLNSSDTSISAVSRQAPDGGNPAEDPGKLLTTKSRNHSHSSPSSDSYMN